MRDETELNRYKVVFAAEDADEWVEARVADVVDGAKYQLVSIEVEASREFVPLQHAYRAPGQRAKLLFGSSDAVEELPVASPPSTLADNNGQLWRLKGDIYAGETKKVAETASMSHVITVLRPRASGALTTGDAVKVGAFTEDGIDLRPVLGRFMCPSLAVFCDGSAPAVCNLRAALEAENCACELQPRDRSALLLFCGPTEAAGLPAQMAEWLCGFQERFGACIVEQDADLDATWRASAMPALQRLQELGESPGALVIGEPGYVNTVLQLLASVGVKAISSTSASRQPLARVVAPEQI